MSEREDVIASLEGAEVVMVEGGQYTIRIGTDKGIFIITSYTPLEVRREEAVGLKIEPDLKTC